MTPRTAKRLGKLAAALALVAAFLVMASVFSPDRTTAGHQDRAEHPPARQALPPPAPPVQSGSTNPHEGLRSLGSLETNGYIVRMYSTPRGPRYSIYDKASGEELAVLMTLEKADEHFPELRLPSMDFSASSSHGDPLSGPLMLADPPDHRP